MLELLKEFWEALAEGKTAARWGTLAAIVGILVVGSSVIRWLFGFLRKSKKPAPDTAPRQIPISITELIEPRYQRYSGLEVEFTRQKNGEETADTFNPPMLSIPNVYISNISDNKSVMLNISLVITDNEGRNQRISNDGRGPFGTKIGINDSVTKLFIKRGLEKPLYIVSPVQLKAQETVHGILPFVIDLIGDEKIDKEIISYYAINSTNIFVGSREPFQYKLEVIDVVSNQTIAIPLPSQGYQGA